MYCCLNYELRNLPILFEYSHTKDGRVDFYVFDKKWCIEVLQCGSKARIAEHAARFATGENYRTWNICEDYIILNFCSKSTLSEIDLEDNVFPSIRYSFVLTRTFPLGDEVQSHILQIVLDPAKYTMEVYTHDNRLLATLILGEGRQRSYSNDYDSPFDNTHILSSMQDQIVRMEKEKENMEQRMQEKENMEQRMKQEKENMEQRMKQEKENMEQRMKQERKDMEQERKEMEQKRKEVERMELRIRRQVEQVWDDMKYQAK